MHGPPVSTLPAIFSHCAETTLVDKLSLQWSSQPSLLFSQPSLQFRYPLWAYFAEEIIPLTNLEQVVICAYLAEEARL